MKEKSFLDEARCDLVVSKKVLAINYVKTKCKRYFIDAFTGMAQGLFCTLIAGTILGQIASWCGTNAFATVLNYIASIAKTNIRKKVNRIL